MERDGLGTCFLQGREYSNNHCFDRPQLKKLRAIFVVGLSSGGGTNAIRDHSSAVARDCTLISGSQVRALLGSPDLGMTYGRSKGLPFSLKNRNPNNLSTHYRAIKYRNNYY